MDEKITEDQAIQELGKGFSKAEKMLQDDEKMERFLQKLEKKLKIIPKVGDALAMLPILISLVRNYVKKRYKNIPIGTIIAIVSALIYVLTPIDLIPDVIVGAGFIDDALVVATCLKLVGSDVEEYKKWRKENNKIIEG